MKNKFLLAAIFFFVVLMIPYFQNPFPFAMPVSFIFISANTFNKIYFIILLSWMIEGVLIFLAIQSLIHAVKPQTPDKFDLG